MWPLKPKFLPLPPRFFLFLPLWIPSPVTLQRKKEAVNLFSLREEILWISYIYISSLALSWAQKN